MKLLLEFFPLLIFFIFYKFFGIIGATIAILCSSVISIALHYLIFKKIPKAMVISTSLVFIMGGATILSGNSNFIKMKPTIFFAAVSGFLFYGFIFKKYYVKTLFEHLFTMPNSAWRILSKRIILFFICLSLLNELIWRGFSETTWVLFKVFGLLPVFIVFMLLQLPLFYKYSEKK